MARNILRKLIGVVSMFTLMFSTLLMPAVAVADAPNGDCDANAVMRCGVADLTDLKNKYKFNQGGDLHAIFAHFGIPNEAAMNGMVMGRVTKTNEVWVGNQKVATGAVTAGRQRMTPNDVQVPGATAYMRPPAVSFRSDSLAALVKMNGTHFEFAVIMSCGNPVSAANRDVMPKPTPPKPTPPKPQPQTPTFEVEKQVKVVGSNNWQKAVTAKPGEQLEYAIVVKNTGDVDLKNVTIVDTLPNGVSFADANLEGEGATNFRISQLTSTAGIKLDTLRVGATVTIRFKVFIGNKTEACNEPLVNKVRVKADSAGEKQAEAKAKVCAEQQPETPETPQVQGTTTPTAPLPDTGPAGVAGIATGTSILSYAAYRLKEFFLALLNK